MNYPKFALKNLKKTKFVIKIKTNNMRRFVNLSLILMIIFTGTIFGQGKRPLDHGVYDDWKSIEGNNISNDGNWISYEIVPQEGDAELYLYNINNQSYTSFQRGSKAVLSANSNYMVFNIKPQFDTVRKMTLDKVKKEKMPKDSMGVFVFNDKKTRKFKDLISFKVSEEDSDWFVAMFKNIIETPKKDTSVSDSTAIKKNKKPSKKTKGDKLYHLAIMNPVTGDSAGFKDVVRYAYSKNGRSCAFVKVSNDSIDSLMVYIYDTRKLKLIEIFSGPGYNANISIDDKGQQVAFTYSNDSIKEKSYGLRYFSYGMKKPIWVVDTSFTYPKEDWSVSEHGKIYFNDKGDELYFGTAPKPVPTPKDTLTKDEKVSVDIWNWKDLKLQPQQLKELDREKKRSYITVYHPSEKKVVQLADKDLPDVSINKKATGVKSIGYETKPYQRMTSWEASRYRDIYLVNRSNGLIEKVMEKVASSFYMSPDQKFILWYNIDDSTWNSYNIKSKKSVNLTGKLNVNFYNELNDIPNEAYPYGFCGWTKSGEPVVYDNYDLWKLDPYGEKRATCITQGYGRNNNIRFRNVKLDRDKVYLPNELLLNAFNIKNKDDGFYQLPNINGSEPQKLVMEAMNFSYPIKAKMSNQLIFTKSSFTDFPDLFTGDYSLKNIHKITNANPQQDEYLWGNVKLVDWVTFNGDTMQGMLYTPENLDPHEKYPMLVYFYERYSDRLHTYYSPKPIRSVINFSYYVSNGYVIFIPDIKYKVGYPGASAYDCIVSGTQAMCDEYDFIDRDNLGIQGQSWGGYQVAYLITRTNMYKAAMAGAPVSNMTSAYGGIRWGSGLSRAFQYEQTQSRIGGDLWDDLPLYIENSPLFYLNRVETPVLIMHNDKDGAVPWYQGIEMFNGLRRLNKPAWMLVYNGGPHNLKRRADCKDLTIRMQQFFDHYLLGAPEPVWMKYGVPAIEKGTNFGYELTD